MRRAAAAAAGLGLLVAVGALLLRGDDETGEDDASRDAETATAGPDLRLEGLPDGRARERGTDDPARDPLVVTGVVQDERGHPIPGATVYGPRGDEIARSRAGGEFTLRVGAAPDGARVLIGKEGWLAESLVVRGGEEPVAVTLRPDRWSRELVLIVSRSDGGPAAGTYVDVREQPADPDGSERDAVLRTVEWRGRAPPSDDAPETDSAGRIVFAGTAVGRCGVRACLDGDFLDADVAVPAGTGPLEVALRMDRGRAVVARVGLVMNAGWAPEERDPPLSVAQLDGWEGLCLALAPAGRELRVEGVPTTEQVLAFAVQGRPTEKRRLPAGTDDVDLGTVDVLPGREVRGTVRDREGTPLADGRLRVRAIDADRAAYARVERGEFTLRAMWPPTGDEEITIRVGDSEERIPLVADLRVPVVEIRLP